VLVQDNGVPDVVMGISAKSLLSWICCLFDYANKDLEKYDELNLISALYFPKIFIGAGHPQRHLRLHHPRIRAERC
jgi:hypothetical protein